MAIGVSEPVAETISNADASSYNGTAYTPAANSVQAIYVVATATVAASPTISGGSGWSTAPALQTSATFNSGVSTIYLFIGVAGASPGSFTPVFDCTGDAATGCSIAVLAFTGANTSTPVVQTKVKNSTTSTNPSITADSNLTTTNGYGLCVANPANPAGITETASWTESVDSGHTSPTTGIFVQYRAGGETGATIATTRAGSINHGIILVEIAAAASSVTGTAAQTLPKLAQAAAGSQTNDGTAAQTLPKLAQSAAGDVDNTRTGTAAQTLPILTQAAAGAQTNDGTAAQTLPSLTQSAAGTVAMTAISGTVAQTLPALAQSAVGAQENSGTVAQTLPSLAQAASGTVDNDRTATIAQTLPALTQAAAGTVESPDVTGTIVQTLPSLTQTAAGTGGTATDTYGGFDIILPASLRRKKKKAIKRRVVKQIAPDIRPLIEEASANFNIDAYLSRLIEDAAQAEQTRLTAEMLARIEAEIRKERAEQIRALEARLAEEARLAVEAAIEAAEREKQRRYRQDENDVLTALMMGII